MSSSQFNSMIGRFIGRSASAAGRHAPGQLIRGTAGALVEIPDWAVFKQRFDAAAKSAAVEAVSGHGR